MIARDRAGVSVEAGPMPLRCEIDGMRREDWTQVRAIYEEGILSGNATFETKAPDWKTWDRAHHARCRLVARDGECVLGWAALAPVSARRVYAGVAEATVYVSPAAVGQGIGTSLLRRLAESSEQRGVWTLQAMVFPENIASLRILAKCGFREAGVRQKIGSLRGVWRDVVLLERRSHITGAGR